MSQERIAPPGQRQVSPVLQAVLLGLVFLLSGTLRAAPPPDRDSPATGPVASGHEEKVTVRLAEIQVLVTDRRGNPVTDLRPEEVTVYERGKKRKLAFLEPFTSRGVLEEAAPQPTPLVTEGGKPPEAEPAPAPVIPPPPPRRRIVLLFDLWNSRTQDRKHWVEAARQWIEEEMRPDDLVSIAAIEMEGRIRTLLNFTDKKESLLAVLGDGSFVESVPYQDWMMDIRRLLDDLQTCVRAYEPDFCSENAVRPYVHEWRVRGETTLGALKRFSAALGAIPGRKVVLYMSAGILPNPGEIATQAVLATFGTETVSLRAVSYRLRRDLQPDILEMLRVANAADVTFFTFDTRPSSMRDSSWTAEQRVKMHERQWMDPFSSIFDESRGVLDTFAVRTGGRSFHGPRIDRNLPLAVRAIEGLYTIGFYRDPRARGLPKVRVKVARRGVKVSCPDRYDPRRRLPRTVPLELAVGKTRPLEDGLLVPVLVQAEVSYLGFRRHEGQWETDVAVYAEAETPDGEVAAESYQLVGVALDEQRYQERATLRFAHQVGLILPPGGYRLRVRLADANFRATAERAIDVTVHPDGTVTPGIQDFVHARESGSFRQGSGDREAAKKTRSN